MKSNHEKLCLDLTDIQIKTLRSTVSTETLFWGQSSILEIINSDTIAEKLQAIEVLDWLSSLYWTEGLAVRYSLSIRDRKKADASERKAWERVYVDEILHQSLIAQWMIDQNLVPLAPNSLVRRAEESVTRVLLAEKEPELEEAIIQSQIFFESLGQNLLHLRLSDVRDRSLQSLLYRIYLDEARHIALGLAQIKENQMAYSERLSRLDRMELKLSPIHLAEGILSDEQMNKVREVSSSVALNLQEIREAKDKFHPHEWGMKFDQLPGYNCIACHPRRMHGLHLQPKWNENTEMAYDEIEFPSLFEGFNGLVHGGAITMALDEMAGYALILSKNLLPVTTKLEIELFKPVRINTQLNIQAKIVKKINETDYEIECYLRDTVSQKNLARSVGIFRVLTMGQGKHIFGDLASHSLIQKMLH